MGLNPLLANEFQWSFIFYEVAYTLSKQSREISRIFDQQKKKSYILDCDNQLGIGWGLK